jgi:hypothetical protein
MGNFLNNGPTFKVRFGWFLRLRLLKVYIVSFAIGVEASCDRILAVSDLTNSSNVI